MNVTFYFIIHCCNQISVFILVIIIIIIDMFQWPSQLGLENTPTKLSDGDILLSFSGPFWFGMIVPDRVLSMGQIELFDF